MQKTKIHDRQGEAREGGVRSWLNRVREGSLEEAAELCALDDRDRIYRKKPKGGAVHKGRTHWGGVSIPLGAEPKGTGGRVEGGLRSPPLACAPTQYTQ